MRPLLPPAPGISFRRDASLRRAAAAPKLPGMAVVWNDGEWIDATDFSLAPDDRGAILGFALFETMLGYDGRPKFAEAHARRLGESCARLGWPVPGIDLETIGRELLGKNGLTRGRGRLRLTMTAGSGPISDKAAGNDARLWISATPADDPPESLAVTVSPWKRNHRSPLAGLKSASYAENILALDHARAAGFGETLFYNTDGHLCEAATSNVFLVRGGTLLTPSIDSGCLPGVSRSVVLRLAERIGLVAAERTLTAEDLAAADEIFLTSAIRGPVPIATLDGRNFAESPVAARLRALWRDEICRA